MHVAWLLSVLAEYKLPEGWDFGFVFGLFYSLLNPQLLEQEFGI